MNIDESQIVNSDIGVTPNYNVQNPENSNNGITPNYEDVIKPNYDDKHSLNGITQNYDDTQNRNYGEHLDYDEQNLDFGAPIPVIQIPEKKEYHPSY